MQTTLKNPLYICDGLKQNDSTNDSCKLKFWKTCCRYGCFLFIPTIWTMCACAHELSNSLITWWLVKITVAFTRLLLRVWNFSTEKMVRKSKVGIGMGGKGATNYILFEIKFFKLKNQIAINVSNKTIFLRFTSCQFFLPIFFTRGGTDPSTGGTPPPCPTLATGLLTVPQVRLAFR